MDEECGRRGCKEWNQNVVKSNTKKKLNWNVNDYINCFKLCVTRHFTFKNKKYFQNQTYLRIDIAFYFIYMLIIMKHNFFLNFRKQVLTGSDSITGSTTTERCLKGSLERSKTSECSHSKFSKYATRDAL